MRHIQRRRAGFAVACVLAAAAATLAVPASANAGSPSQAAPAEGNPDFTGIVRLSNCSGSIVRWGSSEPTDKAMMLTNGHCRKTYGADEVEVNIPLVRTVTLLNPDGTDLANVSTTTLLYGTMAKTDVALYELDLTYAKLENTYGVTGLTIAAKRTTPHHEIVVMSGYWRKAYRCHLNGFVYQLKEGDYTWHGSLRYRKAKGGCNVIHGTSGSPVLDPFKRTVLGIHNTTNDAGLECTLNNPCEIDRQGNITVDQNRHYGEQTWWLTTCVAADRSLNLDKAGCRLRKP